MKRAFCSGSSVVAPQARLDAIHLAGRDEFALAWRGCAIASVRARSNLR
jgi:hypothetical protein